MSEIKIDKGIPAPRGSYVGRPHKYPFREMEVGDSFFIQGDRIVLQNVRMAAAQAGKRLGDRKFIARTEDNGFRCWRVK